MSQITDPPTPYLGPINSMSPGHMIRVQGLAPGNAQRFNINLQCGSNVNPRDDVALHLSVRLLEGYVARNTLDAGLWGTEQGDGALRIAPGQRFEILVLSDANEYKIAINGQHFATFPHRIPPSRVTHLAVDGDVKIGMISEEGGAADASHQATAATEQFGHQEVPSAPPTGGGQYGGYSGPPQGQPGYGGAPQGGYGGPPQGGYGGAPQGVYGQSGYGPPPPPPGHQHPIGFSVPTPIYPLLPKLPSPSPYRQQTPAYPPIPPTLQYHPPSHPPPYPQQVGAVPGYNNYPYQQPYGYPGTTGYPGVNPMSGNTNNNNSPSWMSKLPAMGAMGGVLPMMGKGGKKVKKSHMKKAMKYGLPIAGAGVGAYAISKAVGGHRGHHGRSSSSSSSSD